MASRSLGSAAHLVDVFERPRVVALDAQKEALAAGLPVEVQKVRIPHDVVCPDGAYQLQVQPAGDERLQKGPPHRLIRCRILVGEVDHPNAHVPMQPGQLGRGPLRIPVPPLPPEAVLPAIGAGVGAAPGKLIEHCPAASVVGVVPARHQLPAHAPLVQIDGGPASVHTGRPSCRKAMPRTAASASPLASAVMSARVTASPSPRTM